MIRNNPAKYPTSWGLMIIKTPNIIAIIEIISRVVSFFMLISFVRECIYIYCES